MSAAHTKTTTPLLMPKATSVWLIENTALTFLQIADFVGLTEIEVEALANEEIGKGLVGRNPIENGELTADELQRCEADPAARLKSARRDLPTVKTRSKGPRYTPVSKRGDKPDAIAYIIKQASDISDAQICKLIGTTKPTIESVRDRTHPNSANLRPRHPAELGLCTYVEFENTHNKALKAAGKDPDAIKAAQQAALEKTRERDEDNMQSSSKSGGFDFSNFLPNISSGSNTQQQSVPLDDENF